MYIPQGCEMTHDWSAQQCTWLAHSTYLIIFRSI